MMGECFPYHSSSYVVAIPCTEPHVVLLLTLQSKESWPGNGEPFRFSFMQTRNKSFRTDMHMSKFSLCNFMSVRLTVSLPSVICDWLRTVNQQRINYKQSQTRALSMLTGSVNSTKMHVKRISLSLYGICSLHIVSTIIQLKTSLCK